LGKQLWFWEYIHWCYWHNSQAKYKVGKTTLHRSANQGIHSFTRASVEMYESLLHSALKGGHGFAGVMMYYECKQKGDAKKAVEHLKHHPISEAVRVLSC